MTVFYPDGDEWIMGPVDDIPKLLVFLPLVDFRDGQGKWGLAERWEHSPDYREWIVHLRRNIRWHDGAPVTAHDIKFTIDLWKHPDVLYYAGAPYESVTVLDRSQRVHKLEVLDGACWQRSLPLCPACSKDHDRARGKP
jgi:ABC-type transport system substrate-binding protein